MRILEIDPAIWYRGQGGQDSRLLRPLDSKRCCMGIDGRARGAADADLWDLTLPSAIQFFSPIEYAAVLNDYVKDWTCYVQREELSEDLANVLDLRVSLELPELPLEIAAARINDDPNLSDEIRLKYLRELFALINIDLRLKGES